MGLLGAFQGAYGGGTSCWGSREPPRHTCCCRCRGSYDYKRVQAHCESECRSGQWQLRERLRPRKRTQEEGSPHSHARNDSQGGQEARSNAEEQR